MPRPPLGPRLTTCAVSFTLNGADGLLASISRSFSVGARACCTRSAEPDVVGRESVGETPTTGGLGAPNQSELAIRGRTTYIHSGAATSAATPAAAARPTGSRL